VAAGEELNGQYFSNTWLDPITNTLMMRPSCLYAAWETSNAGIYAKPAGLAYNDSTKWQVGATRGVIQYATTSAANEWVRHGSALAKNRAVWLSVFNHSEGAAVTAQCEAGWSNSNDYLDGSGVGLKLFTDGTVEVYRYGVIAGSGKVGPNTDNQYVDLLLIPCRRRELLVVNPKTYDGFTVVFADIAEDAADPVITPATKFFAKNPSGTLQVAFAEQKFETSGYATSSIVSFTEAPTAADTAETWDLDAYLGGAGVAYKLFGDPSYQGTASASASLVTTTNGAYTADAIIKSVRIKVSLVSDGSYTPFIYGALKAYNATYTTTSAVEEYDASEKLVSCHLSVPDSGTDTSAELEFYRADSLAASVASVKTQCNRPINIKIGSTQLMSGRNDAPDWVDDWNPENVHLSLTVRDIWKAIDRYRFQDIFPLDGMRLDKAMRFILNLVGIQDANLDIETSSYYLPGVPTQKGGWNVLIQQGDTAGEWIRRLVEDYAATWFIGVLPSALALKLTLRSESTLSATPDVTLYASAADAIADGVLAGAADALLYYNFHEQIIEPEANDVWATGEDPRDRRPIQSHKVDDASRNPVTVPSSRPSNWLGEYSRVGLISPELTRQTDTDFAVTTIYDRVTPLGKIVDFECNMPSVATNVPLWRLHRVKLYGKGEYRLLSLDCQFQIETTGQTHRHAKYVARLIS